VLNAGGSVGHHALYIAIERVAEDFAAAGKEKELSVDGPARVARNRATFLDGKERIKLGLERRAKSRFLCECSAGTCAEVIGAPLYEGVHLDPQRFLLALGHARPDVDTILEKTPGYLIVERSESV
jgi:hypothetical protein